MDNITKLPDPINCYSPAPAIDVLCYSDDEFFTIESSDQRIDLTPDEAQYLLEQLILRFQPWNNAG